MKYKLLIFDMDGTILDTLEDLADATNYALSKHNLPGRTIEEVRSFVGNGIKKLIERAVPEGIDDSVIDSVFNTFTSYYKKHCADKTKAYDGICEVIIKARKYGYKTAVVSNKAEFAVLSLCDDYFKGLFDIAAGDKEGIRIKPSPDMVNYVLDMLSIDRKDAVYIGDSDVDVMTAINSDIDLIAVSWGFRGREFLKKHGAEVVIDEPKELLLWI